MKLICKSRGGGKTTELIKRVKEIDGILIVSDIHTKKLLIQTKELDEKSCYSISEIRSGKHLGRTRRPFLIDDADKILEILLGIPIEVCTITKDDLNII